MLASRIQGGLLTDAIAAFFGALATSLPNTTFAQNNGVISLTRCASRQAGIAAAGWLIFMGVFAKVAGVAPALVSKVVCHNWRACMHRLLLHKTQPRDAPLLAQTCTSLCSDLSLTVILQYQV
jgi:hypothetical protein